MRIYIEENYEAMSKKAALLVASQVIINPKSILGLATGGTPLGMYSCLVEMFHDGELDFSEIKTFNLDEYYGLSKEDDQSYYGYMNENFFKHINILKENTDIPNGKAEDALKECEAYDEKIKLSGGIDLQILGIGSNGHIGFNEPADKLNVKTHLVNLSQKTISDNSRFFANKEDVPKQAISVGLETIMKSKKIIMLASGKSKAEAIKAMVSGYVDTHIPASILQTHSDVVLVVDKEAASLID